MTIAVETLIREDERFLPLAEAKRPRSEPEARSIEGAIRLTVDGQRLLDEDVWDDVDALWSYLLNGLVRARQGLSFECGFPNGPRRIRIAPEKGGRVRLSFGAGHADAAEAVAELEPLSTAMALAAREFFAWLGAVAPSRAGEENAPDIVHLLEGGPPPQTWTL